MIETSGLRGGTVRIRADISSQYLSALMMASPFADGPVRIELDGPVVSEPYIQMTERMIAEFNGTKGEAYAIEPDASAASYFFAIPAILGGRITVRGMNRDMLQGDVHFVDALARMGCVVTESQVSYVKVYNAISTAAAIRQFGYNVFAECTADARTAWDEKAEAAIAATKTK